jgi:hypothetical protein
MTFIDEDPEDLIDACEADALSKLAPMEYPIDHKFIPTIDGYAIYERTIYLPAGTFLTTERHEVRHPFNLSSGTLAIFDQKGTRSVLEAPYRGITEPGTRRMMLVLKDITLTTYHVTRLTDPESVIADVTSENDNPLISDRDRALLRRHRSLMPSSTEGILLQ